VAHPFYEYADPDGGGVRTDYFRTGARYTLPTTAGVVRALEDQDITLIGFEEVQCCSSDISDDVWWHEVPRDSHAGKVFDLSDDNGAESYSVDAEEI
jgi:hypothetical protein